jgi:hypothetical protein
VRWDVRGVTKAKERRSSVTRQRKDGGCSGSAVTLREHAVGKYVDPPDLQQPGNIED